MNALVKLALILCLSCVTMLSQAQTQTLSTASPDFSRAELHQMLAPVALYPDTVLSHVLIAATYPLEVVQAARWANANSKLSAESAVAAVENQDWDPSVKALVAFPQILQRMSDDLDWTQRVGDAFLADEAEVMDVIQDLRERAYASGNLDKMEHVKVQREEKIIVIEPAVERVVYVPYYDTRIIYGDWWWPDYPPVHWHHPRHHTYVSGFYWGPRVYVAPSFFFSSFHWHNRRVVVIDYHRHHHPRFYSGRHIAHYHGARHWHHNPVHRRGVVYRNETIRHHYGSNRQSYRARQEERNYQRGHDGHTRPQNVRTHTNNRDADTRPRTHWRGQNDADRVRERLSHSQDTSKAERQNERHTTKTGPRDELRRPERPPAIQRDDKTQRNNQPPRVERPAREEQIQRSGNTEPRDAGQRDTLRQTWRENQQRPHNPQYEERQRQNLSRPDRPARPDNIRRENAQPQRSMRQSEPQIQRRPEQNRPQLNRSIERTPARPSGSGVRESRRIER